MSGKQGFWSKLFGGSKEKTSCCSMQITEAEDPCRSCADAEAEKQASGRDCCDLKIEAEKEQL